MSTNTIESTRQNVLEVEDLSKSFTVSAGSGGSRKLKALDGISLSVGKGETLGLVGESG